MDNSSQEARGRGHVLSLSLSFIYLVALPSILVLPSSKELSLIARQAFQAAPSDFLACSIPLTLTPSNLHPAFSLRIYYVPGTTLRYKAMSKTDKFLTLESLCSSGPSFTHLNPTTIYHTYTLYFEDAEKRKSHTFTSAQEHMESLERSRSSAGQTECTFKCYKYVPFHFLLLTLLGTSLKIKARMKTHW